MEDRIFEFEEENKKLVIKQNLDIGYAGQVWDASLVLIYFFKKQNTLFKNLINNKKFKGPKDPNFINESKKIIFIPKNKIILELGAATGINGFSCGILGAKKIYLTDKEGCCKMLETNYELNKKEFEKEFECKIQELDWTKENQRELIKDKIDYIIGSDLVWNPKLREPLANTIKYYMGLNKDIKCFFSFEIRNNEILQFFNLFDKSKYKLEKIPDYLYDDTYKSEEIIIIRITNL